MAIKIHISATKEDVCLHGKIDRLLRGVVLSIIQFSATWGRPWLSR